MNNEAIEKIRKILALANGLNATQGEMEVAMAKAKEVAMRHNIDIASVGITPEQISSQINVEHDKSLRTRSKFEQPYHRWIFNLFQECFEVRVIRSINRTPNGVVLSAIHIIGDGFDVALVRELFPWLEKLFPKTLSGFVREGRLTYSMADTTGCYMGIYRGMVEANKRVEEKTAPEAAATMALVVRGKQEAIDVYTAEAFPHMKSNRQRSRAVSGWAVKLGSDVGRNIKLNQVGAGSQSKSINN